MVALLGGLAIGCLLAAEAIEVYRADDNRREVAGRPRRWTARRRGRALAAEILLAAAGLAAIAAVALGGISR